MLKLILTGLALIFSLTAFAHEGVDEPNDPGHTPNVCSPMNATVCAHLKFNSKISTQEEGRFIIHVLTLMNQPVQNLKADIWMEMMGHSHGSAPLNIMPLAEDNHFEVTNAWFVMPGTWTVRIEFTLSNEDYKIEIPVNVTE